MQFMCNRSQSFPRNILKFDEPTNWPDVELLSKRGLVVFSSCYMLPCLVEVERRSQFNKWIYLKNCNFVSALASAFFITSYIYVCILEEDLNRSQQKIQRLFLKASRYVVRKRRYGGDNCNTSRVSCTKIRSSGFHLLSLLT